MLKIFHVTALTAVVFEEINRENVSRYNSEYVSAGDIREKAKRVVGSPAGSKPADYTTRYELNQIAEWVAKNPSTNYEYRWHSAPDHLPESDKIGRKIR